MTDDPFSYRPLALPLLKMMILRRRRLRTRKRKLLLEEVVTGTLTSSKLSTTRLPIRKLRLLLQLRRLKRVSRFSQASSSRVFRDTRLSHIPLRASRSTRIQSFTLGIISTISSVPLFLSKSRFFSTLDPHSVAHTAHIDPISPICSFSQSLCFYPTNTHHLHLRSFTFLPVNSYKSYSSLCVTSSVGMPSSPSMYE